MTLISTVLTLFAIAAAGLGLCLAFVVVSILRASGSPEDDDFLQVSRRPWSLRVNSVAT